MSDAAAPSCGATCGVTRERDRQRVAARSLVALSFPSGDVSDAVYASDAPPFAQREATELAASMAMALPCQTMVVEGARATWLYLVATTANRTWLGLREHGDRPPMAASEQGLRVGLSSLGRYATLQEISLTGVADAEGWWVEETRCAGVVDRRLQTFVKAAQGILRRAKVSALDAVFLSEAVPGADASLPNAPSLWNGLFDPDPMTATVGLYIPRHETLAGLTQSA